LSCLIRQHKATCTRYTFTDSRAIMGVLVSGGVGRVPNFCNSGSRPGTFCRRHLVAFTTMMDGSERNRQIKALRKWAQVYRQRDDLIQAAAAAGVGVNEITRITGIAKTTVIRVLRKREGSTS